MRNSLGSKVQNRLSVRSSLCKSKERDFSSLLLYRKDLSYYESYYEISVFFIRNNDLRFSSKQDQVRRGSCPTRY